MKERSHSKGLPKSLLAIIFIVLLLAIAVPLIVYAGDGTGATVQKDFRCRLNAADSVPGTQETLVTYDTHSVVTPSGNSVVVCKFELPDEQVPEAAFLNRGFICATFAGDTDYSKVVITPGGNVTLVCHVRGREVPDPIPTTEGQDAVLALNAGNTTSAPSTSFVPDTTTTVATSETQSTTTTDQPVVTESVGAEVLPPPDTQGNGGNDHTDNGNHNGLVNGGGNGNGNGNGGSERPEEPDTP